MSAHEPLFELLPAVYRVRDAAHDHVLRALLEIVDAERDRVRDDIERLYDNWFIETCDDWVVPYVGDLLGVRGLAPVAGSGITRRAMVANTLAYRRGKGTAAMLEQLARDVTGWPARAVEAFELLATTQYVNHVRAHATLPDLRDWNRMQLVDSPFDRTGHTADVRHVDVGRGLHNVPNVALFLWRLGAYPLAGVRATPAGEGLFRFDPRGVDAPLFVDPATEAALAQLAGEHNVPGPLRRGALHVDLQDYARAHGGRAPEDRPANSLLYGPDRSVSVSEGTAAVPPSAVVAADLSAWTRPPAGVAGVASASLAPFPALTSASPSLDVQMSASGPHAVALAAVPGDLDDARALLEDALRAAAPEQAFAGARVAVAGDRLVILPGVPGAPISVAPSAADATTASELGLDAGTEVFGVLSRALTEPRPADATEREIAVTIDGDGPRVAVIGALPAALEDVRAALEDALRGAGSTPAFQDAVVTVVDDRVLVLPGVLGARVSLAPTADDPRTAAELGLVHLVAIDPVLGRLAFSPGGEPAADVRVRFAYAFGADIGGGSYERRDTLARDADVEWRATVSQSDPGAGFATIGDALAAWADPTDGAGAPAAITIADDATYAEEVVVDLPPGGALTLQAASGRRPLVAPAGAGASAAVRVVGGTGGDASLTLDGVVVAGGIAVEADSVGRLRISHCTLVPGHRLAPGGASLAPHAASIGAGPGNEQLSVVIERSITGPLALHEDVASLTVRDSIVDAPALALAWVTLSGNLSPFPALSSPTPAIAVTIGDEGPHTVALDGAPASLAQARDVLQTALRTAHPSDAFTGASVAVAANRLVVVGGDGAPVEVGPAPDDATTAAELRFDDPAARRARGLLGAPLEPFTAPSSATPALEIAVGAGPRRVVELDPAPTTLAQARARLQAAVRAAGTEPEYADALVAAVAGRLLVVPGTDDADVDVRSTRADRSSATELGLLRTRPALSWSDDGTEAGPRSTFERATVLGEVFVRELALASEVVFARAVYASRRQLGCVRFSYVPPGSRAPRRYRCQPSDATDARVRPLFESMSYGEPGYARLSRACAPEIAAGASGDGEMGAYNLVQQNQRIGNLKASLDEYLRLGLEAGVFLAT
ncbi:MAG TPA: hypothetical protein VHJ34_04545 [Actinomycetota bacterium]|nr:hypothetical protein [Actinomycetota bacterium]